jgi:hypothetical protein
MILFLNVHIRPVVIDLITKKKNPPFGGLFLWIYFSMLFLAYIRLTL